MKVKCEHRMVLGCRARKRLIMRFQGNLYKDGKFWLAEVPMFAALMQGRTRKEAIAMIADWFETLINRAAGLR